MEKARIDYCPACEQWDDNWTAELQQGAEVELDRLQRNQRVGYGTGNDDHMLYTHQCPLAPARGEK